MTAYYNEHDPFAAAWLRELIADNLIAPGEVDERSIEDVTPDDLRPFRQCHFFAGIGVWSLAARRAGIPDDAPLWSGSCPCQPFSAAGKGGGFADERHLWPAFHYLIEQCEPPLVVGEQVAGADGDAWLDLVSADLDATGYAFGAAETCAAGFGAPHIRSRNYWVAVRLDEREREREREGLEGLAGHGNHRHQPGRLGTDTAGPVTARGDADRLALTDDAERRSDGSGGNDGNRQEAGRIEGTGDPKGFGGVGRVADAARGEQRGIRQRGSGDGRCELPDRRYGAIGILGHLDDDGRQSGGLPVRQGRPGEDAPLEQRPRKIVQPGPTNGLWRDVDWLRCRDEPIPKWRPVEPGTFPLVDAGTFRNRVGLLRGAGNAITLGQAEGFLRAVIGSVTA